MSPVGITLAVWMLGQVPGPPGPRSPYITPDEQTLRGANLATDGPSLLKLFRQRASTEVKPEYIGNLIKQLGDPGTEIQNKAIGDLITLGAPAITHLRQAANSLDDLEAAGRAKRCLQNIEGPVAANLLSAAARLVAQAQPQGAAEVLLHYLPFGQDDVVLREVETALAGVASKNGNLDPAIIKALADPQPIRRGIAAATVCQMGKPELRDLVRPLMKDPKPMVRLRAALGLANLQEADAVPILIDLLGELPQPHRNPAEMYLWQLSGEWYIGFPAGNDEVSRRLRRDLWTTWWKNNDGPTLLDEFRKRTVSDLDGEKILTLIRQLGDESETIRDQASSHLLALGKSAAPLLRQATGDSNPRISAYAAKCLAVVEKDQPNPLPIVTIRLLALRKPPGSLEALLAYLPFADNQAIASQVQNTLGTLAIRDGKPDPLLLQALSDKVGLRRLAAAELICQAGAKDHLPAVRKLLGDPEPLVRMRVALAMAELKEKEAVPVLISLLADLPAEHGWQVEEYLLSVAGDHAPIIILGREDESRKKCRDAWTLWWREHQATVDLSLLATTRFLGHTLVLEQNSHLQGGGRLYELDAQNRPRWEIRSLNNPTDAHYLPGDRVLIAEQATQTVSERDTKGNIVWQHRLTNLFPLACQRLRNGNTFIVCNNRLVEVDRDKREVFSYARPNNDLVAAKKFRDGQIGFLTQSGMYTRLDQAGKEVRSFKVGTLNYYSGGMEVLPNDHVLLPQTPGAIKLQEYDQTGKLASEIPLPFYPNNLSRLPNGNTLLSNPGVPRIVEIDRAGKVAWEFRDPSLRPVKVRRR